jgi:hypothetical protein
VLNSAPYHVGVHPHPFVTLALDLGGSGPPLGPCTPAKSSWCRLEEGGGVEGPKFGLDSVASR